MPRRKPKAAPPVSEVSHTQLECPFRYEPLGPKEGEGEGSGRIAVRFISRRVRLIDPDNLTPKYLLDGLRYAGLIFDDRAEDITVSCDQEKVAHREEEETIIEITYVDERQIKHLLDSSSAKQNLLDVRQLSDS